MKKAIVWMLVFSLVLGVVLVGCGKTGEKQAQVTETTKDTSTETTKDTSTETTKDTSEEKITLKAMFWGSPQEKIALEAACERFSEKYPNVTVEPMHVPEPDVDAKLAALVASNDTPDYSYVHPQQAEPWAKEGKFINWFEMLAEDEELSKEDFVDGIWFTVSPDNAYAVSGAVESFGLFYNKDLFKEAGVPYPPAKYEEAWTWDQFVEAAKKLTVDKSGKNATQAGFDPTNIRQYGVSFENWFGPYMVHVLNNGGDYISADGTTFTLSNPEATSAIQRLADLINVHHVAPSPIQAKAIPGQAAALQSKMVAMSMHGQWINLDLGIANVNYGIGALPKMDKESGTMIISGANTMFKGKKENFEWAWKFNKFMTGEGVEELYVNGLWMPTLKKYYTDPALLAKWIGPNPAHPESFKDSMLDMVLNHSKPSVSYYVKNFGRLDAVVSAALDLVWMGKKSAADALKDIELTVAKEIQGRYTY